MHAFVAPASTTYIRPSISSHRPVLGGSTSSQTDDWSCLSGTRAFSRSPRMSPHPDELPCLPFVPDTRLVSVPPSCILQVVLPSCLFPPTACLDRGPAPVLCNTTLYHTRSLLSIPLRACLFRHQAHSPVHPKKQIAVPLPANLRTPLSDVLALLCSNSPAQFALFTFPLFLGFFRFLLCGSATSGDHTCVAAVSWPARVNIHALAFQLGPHPPVRPLL